MESNTKKPYSFTTPYFYAGLMIAGNPDYVDCVEAAEGNKVNCQGLRICTLDDSMHQDILLKLVNGITTVPNNNVESMIDKLQTGICNVVAAEPHFLLETENMFGDREWKMGTKILSQVPLSHVTRQDDTEWSMLANMAINAFIIAETNPAPQQIAQELDGIPSNIESIGDDDATYQMDIDFVPMMLSLISEFSDYGGVYESHIQALIPPGFGYNAVYDKYRSSGLLMSYPFGNLNELGPRPAKGGTLDSILSRGYLICGIIPGRGPWFASPSSSTTGKGYADDWTGFDVNFCQAIAASLFNGDGKKIVFVAMESFEEAYKALDEEDVDVVAGARVTLQAMFQEPTTGKRFAFSSPYFYDNDTHDAFALMTRVIDERWSDYVFWIVMAIIYAEEEGIRAANSIDMPLVSLFGEVLDTMLSDCISFVGNYADMYNNSLQNFIPRSGANMLNDGAGPQLYPVPIV